jgi:hypothetical protein
MHIKKISTFLILLCLLPSGLALADGDLPTKFSNQATIGNTRHNMTQRATSGSSPAGELMDFVRNDYNEVCVYCHTPHGANTNITAPLWNRTIRATTYTLYNQQSLSGDVTQPGPNSLTCLSCHDGQTAIDSIVNMPGGGANRYRVEQMDSQNLAFLNSWPKSSRAIVDANAHNALNNAGCLSCHNSTTEIGAPDFAAAAIGTDLSNDHPIGVKLPSGSDWNVPAGTRGNVKYFDTDGTSSLTKNDIRVYDTGQGHEVECASCHDPHGVPGQGGTFLPTFLRVTADSSTICLTCHVK